MSGLEYPMFYEDINFLAEMYDLNTFHFEHIVKEDIRISHAYLKYGDPVILQEGFSDMVNNMGEFFKKMIQKIKEFFRKIFMVIDAHLLEIDKFCARYKKELDDMKINEFELQGNKFTINNKPNMSPYSEMITKYNSTIGDISKLKKDDIDKQSDEWMSDQHLANVRGVVLGSNEAISDSDFLEKVRKYYRDGEDDTVDITVNDAMFHRMVRDSKEFVKQRKEAVKLRDDLINLMDKTWRFFDQKAATLYVKKTKKIATQKLTFDANTNTVTKQDEEYQDWSSDNREEMTNKYIRLMYNYSHSMAGIVNLVATEYANAYKDQVKFCKEVVLKSMSNTKDKDDDKTSSSSGED